MKKVLIATSALGLVLSVAAFAGGSGISTAKTAMNWSVGVEGGVVFTSGFFASKERWPAVINTGYDVSVHVGYDFPYDLTAAFEYLYVSNGEVGASKNTLSQSVFMVNGLYTIDMDTMNPYVGVGIGYAHPTATHLTRLPSVQGGFAYQVIAGIEYKLNQNMWLSLNYHFMTASGHIAHKTSYPHYHLLNAGLNVYF